MPKQEILNLLIIIGAKYILFLSVAIAGIYFFRLSLEKKKELIIFSLAFMPLAYLAVWIVSLFYNNPRPFVVGGFVPLIPHGPDNGFPSDHALLSSALAMAIYFFDKKIGSVLMLLAIVISVSRVLAGVHHITDVSGSLMSSIIVSSLVYYYLVPKLPFKQVDKSKKIVG